MSGSHFIVIRYPFNIDRSPTVEHANYDNAISEAERLTKKHPEYSFRVYEFVAESWATVTVQSSICSTFNHSGDVTDMVPPNAKADLAPASGAQVQRLVGRIESQDAK